MRQVLLSAITLALVAVPAVAQQQPVATQAGGSFVNAQGQQIGRATLRQTPTGVLVEVEIRGLPPGEHGFHIHETGRCDPATGFNSAGGHFAPRGERHGYQVEGGPHAGDMPNQFVGQDGVLRAHVLNPNVTLGGGQGTLFDADGSALVVHANPDDYRSQPSGDAGGRLACAAIEHQG
jgi:Cu-Zn family superoxide dismutase